MIRSDRLPRFGTVIAYLALAIAIVFVLTIIAFAQTTPLAP